MYVYIYAFCAGVSAEGYCTYHYAGVVKMCAMAAMRKLEKVKCFDVSPTDIFLVL